ncbi:hypothetical protein NC651_026778 [Populus alba x Populus x berolinensis]|nr:hypothetical protein NC651_026778 [Populus alba x Populus x berolinensis]
MPEKRMDELWVFFPFMGRGREEGRAHEKAKTREGRVSSVNGLLGYFYFAGDFLYRIGQTIAIP